MSRSKNVEISVEKAHQIMTLMSLTFRAPKMLKPFESLAKRLEKYLVRKIKERD